MLLLGLGDEVILLLLALAASVFTIVGGVGGGLYMAYFACVGILVIVLMYFFGAFYMMGDSTTHNWGFAFNDRPVLDSVCDIIQCGQTGSGAGNLDNSLLTFSSMKGFLFGVCCILSTQLRVHGFRTVRFLKLNTFFVPLKFKLLRCGVNDIHHFLR